jgi:hypothetical protein
MRRHGLALALGALIATAVGANAQEAQPASPEPDTSGKITLQWQIDSAEDNYGFYLMRSESENGPWTRVNEAIIPGVGTTSDIHRFSYEDTGLVRGREYWYDLYEVSMSGQEVLKGTLQAHCRTTAEDIVHERQKSLAAEVEGMGDSLVTPLRRGEWVVFLYPRPRRDEGVSLIGDWRGWEADPAKMELMPDSQLYIAEEPATAFPATQERFSYLFVVGGGVSAENHLDPTNAEQRMDDARGEQVSVFSMGAIH